MPEDVPGRMSKGMQARKSEQLPMPKHMSGRTSKQVAGLMAEQMSEYMAENMPEDTSEPMLQHMSCQSTGQFMPEDMPERVSEVKSEHVPIRTSVRTPDLIPAQVSMQMLGSVYIVCQYMCGAFLQSASGGDHLK